MSARVRFLALALLASSGGCALASPPPAPAAPAAATVSASRMTEAVITLERDYFALARNDLLSVASHCADAKRRRRATLLLAAAELDTGNPDGSPSEAARLAERYMRLPDVRPDEALVARALYRVAVHLETLAPTQANVAHTDAAAPDPVTACQAWSVSEDESRSAPGPTAAPWVLSLEMRSAESRRRIAELEAEVAELEAEIDRITGLLTSVTPATAEEPGR